LAHNEFLNIVEQRAGVAQPGVMIADGIFDVLGA